MARRPSSEHQEAVARRLAQLSAELAEVRPDLDGPTRPRLGGPSTAGSDPMHTHTRVRPRPGQAPVGPAREPDQPGPAADDDADPLVRVPPLVPRPGRHAARRRRPRAAQVLPETVRGRVALGPAQLALVAVLVAVGLAVTTWWVVRGDARPVAAPVVTGTAPGLATAAPGSAGAPGAAAGPALSTASSGASPPTGTVTVDVAGKVRRPGIAVLDAGSRVVDALEAAGGARAGVDLSALNLARVLVDGEQVLVGVPAPVGAGTATEAAPGAPGPLVNLNTAGMAELETLPDVGPVTAEAIIAWRTEHGGFTSVEELLEVDGIGDATLETIAPHVTV